MTNRLKEIFSLINSCEVFADIGCDHGYISYEMLKQNKAKRVIFSDVSPNCLSKANALLCEYVKSGRAEGYVSNGFENLPPSNLALIAGMGGEEIISIITNAKNLPDELVLQPMKNTEKVRENLINNGYKIVKDYTFKADKKFYDLIYAKKGKDSLTLDEMLFGRTNLQERPSAFIEKISIRANDLRGFIANENVSAENKQILKKELEVIEKLC